LAERVCQDYEGDPGDTTRWSYARYEHLYFRHSWHRHFHELWKGRVYLARYRRQEVDWILDLPMSEFWRYVHYTSEAIKSEQPKNPRRK